MLWEAANVIPVTNEHHASPNLICVEMERERKSGEGVWKESDEEVDENMYRCMREEKKEKIRKNE